MKNSIFGKKIPTLLGLLLITIGIGVTSYLTSTGIIFFGKAAASTEPKQLLITNISDTSFTVIYTTENKVVGTIMLGKDSKNLSQTILDERDQSKGASSFYTVHSITAKNLTPNTQYFFSIISGNSTYTQNNIPYDITTAPSSLTKPNLETLPLSGSIILLTGDKPSEALISLKTDNSQIISSLIKSDGSYIIPLNNTRTVDLKDLASLTDQKLQLIISTNLIQSHVITSLANSHPIPLITLSKDYDFSQTKEPLATSSAQTSFGFPTLNTTVSNATQIITPKKDEGFSDQKPLFEGTAKPNTKVQITIQSTVEIAADVTSDNNGYWSYRPDSPLNPGKHTLTIVANDASGTLKTVTQSFIVYASGSQFTDNISPTQTTTPQPTATPTTNTTLTPSVTVVPTTNPTLNPTITLSLTPTESAPTPTNLPIDTPTNVPTIISSKTPQINPPPGNQLILPVGIAALASIMTGMLLLLF